MCHSLGYFHGSLLVILIIKSVSQNWHYWDLAGSQSLYYPLLKELLKNPMLNTWLSRYCTDEHRTQITFFFCIAFSWCVQNTFTAPWGSIGIVQRRWCSNFRCSSGSPTTRNWKHYLRWSYQVSDTTLGIFLIRRIDDVESCTLFMWREET